MAAVEGEELCGILIRITVRSPKERKEVDVNEANTVKQLKEQIAADFSATYDQLCVIFAGKILGDTDRLSHCGVRDGMTLHLVIKSANRDTSSDILPQINQTAPMQIDIGATPFGLGDMGGLAGLSNLGMGSANFMDLQQSLQKEVFRNPSLLRSVMDNPLVQHITSSPGMMHQLINSNPQMRELMERNPEISDMLNNTELMSQTLEMARHPAMLQEMMRSHDRNANPERAATFQDVNAGAARAAEADGGAGFSGAGAESETAAERLSSRAATARSAAAAGLKGSVFRDSSITSMMQQMMQNPQLMTNILQSPYMQSMMQYMTTNPELMQQMICLNPMFANSPALQEQMRQSIPYINQQFGNTDVQSLMTNPRCLQAMLQIQEGLQQLESEAPNLVTRLGIAPQSIVTPAPVFTDGAQAPVQRTVNPYAQFMSHMLSSVSGGDENLPEDVRYTNQMTQLSAMGFINVDSNLQALVASSGNVNVAIDTLMKQRSV